MLRINLLQFFKLAQNITNELILLFLVFFHLLDLDIHLFNGYWRSIGQDGFPRKVQGLLQQLLCLCVHIHDRCFYDILLDLNILFFINITHWSSRTGPFVAHLCYNLLALFFQQIFYLLLKFRVGVGEDFLHLFFKRVLRIAIVFSFDVRCGTNLL